MIGSRVTVDVTVDAPREQKQLGCSVKCLVSAAGFSFPSLPLPTALIFLLPQSHVSCNSLLPERKRKRLLRRLTGVRTCVTHFKNSNQDQK